MDNSYAEFKVPDYNETRPRPKPKRLAELNLPFQFSASKPKNAHFNTNSAKKYSTKKSTNLSQNMSTSKKLLYQKKSNAHTFKRAIDFASDTVKNNLPTMDRRSQRMSKIQQYDPDSSTRINETKTYKRQSYFREESPSVKQPTEKIVKDKSHLSAEKKIRPERRNSSPRKKREPLSSIESQIYPINENSLNLSDKENFDHSVPNIATPENQISVGTVNLMNNYEKSLQIFKELQTSNCPEGFQNFMALTKTNIEITSKVIQEILKLLQNNMELYNSYLNVVNNMENKKSSCDIQISSCSKQNCESENAGDDNDLRKLALVNSQRMQKVIKAPEPVVKKSELMFATMKSNMNFLKTPKTEKRGNAPETPTTNCRNITRGNVMRQLESLYDT